MLTALSLSVWSALCAGFDLSARRIPNALTAPACAAAFACYASSGAGPLGAPWLPSVSVGLGALVVGSGLFAAGWVGAGDVKLWTAMACLAGPEGFAATLLIGSLLAGIAALWMLRVERVAPIAVPSLSGFGLKGLSDGARARIPLAAPYGLGFAVACWELSK